LVCGVCEERAAIQVDLQASEARNRRKRSGVGEIWLR
jgi:hypothetical protein